jgi:hypothetical protein
MVDSFMPQVYLEGREALARLAIILDLHATETIWTLSSKWANLMGEVMRSAASSTQPAALARFHTSLPAKVSRKLFWIYNVSILCPSLQEND